MPLWKKNLAVCWFGMFVTSIGLSQIAPILPLYIQQLGIDNTESIEKLSGISFGITFLISAIFSPIWGIAADRYGRKIMLLRASFGMALIVFTMAFVTNVYQLIFLRMLQGTVTGFATACTILIATQTERKHAGWALGTLSTASISGSLFGPLLGALIGEKFGFQSTFFITGSLLLVAFIIAYFFVTENFKKRESAPLSFKESWLRTPNKSVTLSMFVTYFMIHVAVYAIEPVITIYILQISLNTAHVALIAGITFSASGLANILTAPRLGRLSDKIGPDKIILYSLIAAGIIFIPQGFVTAPWQLVILRFILGVSIAGLTSPVNILLKKITPDQISGTIFGLNMSARFLGICLGSILGGQIAAYWGFKTLFFSTSLLMFLNAIWIYIMVYKKRPFII